MASSPEGIIERAAGFSLARRVLRLAGQALCALLLLLGLLAVCAQVDMAPWVGDALRDVWTWEDLNAPVPAYFNRLVPVLVVGIVLVVVSFVGILRRFPNLKGVVSVLRWWSCWALAAMLVKAATKLLSGWPEDAFEASWTLRVVVLNAATSATLLTVAQWLLGRYAHWRARPSSRWGEAAMWFAMVAVLITGFNVAMTLLGGLASERLAENTLQMALVFGGLLALAVALTPRPATPSRPGGTRTPNQTVMSGRL